MPKKPCEAYRKSSPDDHKHILFGFALILLLVYSTVTFWVAVVAYNIPVPFLNPQQPRQSFQLVAGIYLQKNKTNIQPPDVSIAFTFSYDRLMAANEAVNVNGVAELLSAESKNFTSVTVLFQNGFAYPLAPDSNGILQKGIMILTFTDSPNLLKGTLSLAWNIDGTFYPEISAYVRNRGIVDFGLFTDVPIQVLPYERLLEAQTNRVSLVLTYALFIMTALGIINTLLAIARPTKMVL